MRQHGRARIAGGRTQFGTVDALAPPLPPAYRPLSERNSQPRRIRSLAPDIGFGLLAAAMVIVAFWLYLG